MTWTTTKLGEFLRVRESRFKPHNAAIRGLKRVDKIDFSGKIYLSELPSKTDMILVKNGDLLISGINVYKGAVTVYEGEEDIIATIHYSSYEYDSDKIDVEFLKLFLKSPEFLSAIKEQVAGGIKTEIKPKHLLPLKVTIPDIESQRQIVRDFSTIEKKNSLLAAEFRYRSTQILKLRQAVLREAMKGKLLPQEPNDEPASKLLKRINAEKERLIREKKLKKDKPLPPIKAEEIPYKLPDNWVWCRLGELRDFNFSLSYGVLVPGDDVPNGIPFVRVQDLDNAPNKIPPTKTIHADIAAKYARTKLIGGEILICVVGSIGKLAMVPDNWIGANIARAVCRYMPNKLISGEYIYHCLTSPYVQALFQAGHKSINPTLNVGVLEKTLIPLPPLLEQIRLCEKIKEIESQCNQLKTEIELGNKNAQLLLQIALKEALQEKEVEQLVESN